MKGLTTFLFYIVLPVVLLSIIFWFGWGSSIVSPKEGLVLKDPFSVDFGEVSRSRKVLDREIEVKNESDKEIIINNIYTDCACLSVSINIENNVIGGFSTPSDTDYRNLNLFVPLGKEIKMRASLYPESLSPGKNFSGRIFIKTVGHESPFIFKINARITE